ncbi:MAG: MotA/TolQ/ExbB proton channel family protein, partial [Pseudobdellovibrionaceae bacterium]
RKSVDYELAVMESKLPILATTGSTGPFIGLFGTVWGIMGSFHKIGATGNASLAVVAPGISEALIATAIGLAAAIPAVMLYNHFVATIRKEELELNNFATDFLNIAKRNFFKG